MEKYFKIDIIIIMSEFEFINRLKNLVTLPLGLYPDSVNLADDICVLGVIDNKTLIASGDSLSENVHFFANDPINLIVKKAIRTNISDIACKGAVPYGMMFNICLPKHYHNDAAQTLIITALQEDLTYYNIPLLGGDTTSGETLTISITIFGLCTHPIPHRKNLQLHDTIYVTGTLGLAKIGLDLRHNAPQALSITKNTDIYANAYLLPTPPLWAGIALAPYMNASMDISDGLLGDLQKMIRANDNNWGFKIDNTHIPCADIDDCDYALDCALYGGDDYQILFTSSANPLTLFNIAKEHKIKLSSVGTITNVKNAFIYSGFSHL
jgi:thiamine-monophosphate kinase